MLSLTYSCSTQKPAINSFSIDRESIEIGQEVQISYISTNSESSLLTFTNKNGIIDTINKVQNMYNTYSYKPESSGEFTLQVKNGDEVTTSYKKVVVNVPKPPKVEPPTTIIADESKDSSQYLKGIIPIDLAKNRDIFFEIFSYDRTGFPDSIKVFITVKDSYGNFISNMATPYASDEIEKKYFKGIVEVINNQRYEIESFDVVEHHDEYSKPYTFSLVLDHSGSMQYYNSIEELQKAAINFIKQKKNMDRIGIIKFDNRLLEEVKVNISRSEITNDYIPDLLTRFNGGTSLYAAADMAIYQLIPFENRIVILFTDGLDNMSLQTSFEKDFRLAYSPLDLVYNARKSDTKIFTIGYGQADFNILSKISYLTDGKTFKANNGNEINEIINSLPRLFNNYYEITYKPKSIKGWRDIEINTVDNSLKDFVLNGGTHIGEDFDFGEEPDIILKVANFDYNKSSINEDDNFIKSVLAFYKKFPDIVIELHGHSDSKGNPDYNKKLSLKRAKSIEKILVKKGIPQEKIISLGHGSEYLIYNPDTLEWQRKENRRVEARFIRSGEFKKGYFNLSDPNFNG
jgi:outer membrane protein OmpA-like peptidoglycan-associated protein